MEVLISVLVLSVGMVSVAVLITSSIKSSVDARNQIIATQLAQEGVELVRNIRDNNLIDFKSTSLQCFSVSGAFYQLGKNIGIPPTCAAPRVPVAELSNPAFYMDDGSAPFVAACSAAAGFYTYPQTCGAAGNRKATKFYREIMITNVPANNNVEATAYVTWNGTGFPIGGDTVNNCTIANKCVSIVSVISD